MSGSDALVAAAFRERLQQQARAAGVNLVSVQVDHLTQYFRLLLKWNRVINLTALPLEDLSDRTIGRLFIEPLQAAPFLDDVTRRWLDLGSGGGSPAIPLKIAKPEASLTMVESRSRKAAFLREVVAIMALTETNVLTLRIQDLAGRLQPGLVDLMTVRAVRLERELLKAVRTLLRPQGKLLLFGSKSLSEQAQGFQLSARVDLFGGNSTLQVLLREG